MQLVGEGLFSLRSEILARICPSQIWQSVGLTLEKVYALMATVGGSPMLEQSVDRGSGCGYVDRQLKSFRTNFG